MDEKDVLKNKSIFVIAVCRNEDKYIAPFINSILASTVPVNLILVDNNSDTANKQKLQEFSESATILWQEKNLGFGIANNIGISYAMEHNAKYIFLLNMDMVIEPDTIETLLHLSLKNPEFAIISPLCFNFEKNSFEAMFFESLTNKNIQYNADTRLFCSEMYFKKAFSKELYSSTYINAAHWFMPIETIKQVGGFNPVFFPIYGEDEEFLNRLSKRELKVGFTPLTQVFHDTENRAISPLIKKHGTCICYYNRILKSEYWQTYYLYFIIFFIRLLLDILKRDKASLKCNYLGIKAYIRWKKILKKTWIANYKKESIGLYCDIPNGCIPPYIEL